MTTETCHKARVAVSGSLLLAATLALSGCFFGGADDVSSSSTSGTTMVPATAQSVTGFVAFLRTLVNDETSEPLAIDASFTPVQSDTAEPETL